MDAKPFRKRAKEPLLLKVPVEFSHLIRLRAVHERRSISELCVEAMARGLGVDPAELGIDAATSPEGVR